GYSYLGAFTERGRVCKIIIIVNIALFAAQLLTIHQEKRTISFTPPGGTEKVYEEVQVPVSLVSEWLELKVDLVMQGQVWRLLTYAFLHSIGGVFHILFNMIVLWWFGTDVEDLYGPREFLAIYLVAAVIGGIAFSIVHLVAGQPDESCVGASGAVMAI